MMTDWSVSKTEKELQENFMAKDTLNKLPKEKQDRILGAAAKLFAQNGFMKTDVAKIAQAAGVAKGSMYNYFESKDAIYRDVCLDGLRRSREAVYGGIDSDWNIYRQIEHIFRQGAVFARKYPEYVLMYLNVSSAGMERFAETLSRQVEKYTADHLKTQIIKGLAAGIVRKDIDVNMTAFGINGLYILFLSSLVSRHFQLRLMEYLELGAELDSPTVTQIGNKMVSMICRNLQP